MKRPLRIDSGRLWQSIMEHARIGATPEGGLNREALTDADKAGRDLFALWCRDAGMEVTVDDLGDMYATLPGTEPGRLAIATGSHLDTQRTGGRFDGVLGVLAGLEVARTLRDAGIAMRHPLTVVNWTAEEGGRFKPSMAASGVYAGIFQKSDAAQWADREGIGFLAALEAIGYRGTEPVGRQRFRALLELHIEQGPVLERERKQIGVVTHAQAMSFSNVTIHGRPSHAGTTPMEDRLDPMSAFVRIAASCEALARAIPDSRFTVGAIHADPGSHSVIPKQVSFTLDLRHPLQRELRRLVDGFESAAHAEGQRGYTVTRTEFGASPELPFAPECVAAVRQAALSCGYGAMDIVSGAGHDAVYVARVCPTGMIFVPCRGGVSHNPAESITQEQAAAGANVLLQAILALDNN
jgi:beta-ureidopropionase / N-carbamoyl-L-amino-acid hydrolase